MRPWQEIETYQDGYVEIYEEKSRRITGIKGKLPFLEKSVGINRYYQAKEAIEGSRIDKLIKVPKNPIAERNDIIVIRGSGKQYRISRIQEKPEQGAQLWELQSVQVQIQKGEEDAGNSK